MTPTKIDVNKKVISTSLGRFHRALETKKELYFVNYQEGDENGSVMIYNKKTGKLICDNYHASQDLWNVIKKKKYIHITRTLMYNYKCSLEQ